MTRTLATSESQSADSSVIAVAGAVFREHRILLILVISYIVAGGLFLSAIEQPWPLRLWYVRPLAVFSVGSIGYLLFAWLRHPRLLRSAVRASRVLSALLVCSLFAPAQITFQSLKQSIGSVRDFTWDQALNRLDIWMHGGPAWHWTSALIHNNTARLVLDVAYVLWIPLMLLWLTWMAWSPRRALRLRGLTSFTLTWIVCGTIGAWIFASAGPCFIEADEYEPLLALLRGDDRLVAPKSQAYLLTVADEWTALGGISAFPSMHVAAAVIVAFTARERHVWFGVCAWLYAGTIQIATVALGWHYAIDGYAGALIAWACWSAARHLMSKSSEPPPW